MSQVTSREIPEMGDPDVKEEIKKIIATRLNVIVKLQFVSEALKLAKQCIETIQNKDESDIRTLQLIETARNIVDNWLEEQYDKLTENIISVVKSETEGEKE